MALNFGIGKKWAPSRQNEGYLFILPYYAFIVVFFMLPVIGNIGLSFTDYNIRTFSFIGVRNYQRLLGDPIFLRSVRNTLIYTIFMVPGSMATGLFMALLLRRKIPGLSAFRTVMFLPHVISMVAASMMWLWFYEAPFGILNRVLSLAGIGGRPWLFDPRTALGSIIIMSIWKALGYNTVIFLAGIHAIPRYLYEAAMIDGARSPQCFWHITLPMLRPVSFFLFITGLINSFQVFEQVNVMTAGGPRHSTTTITHQIYTRGLNQLRMGYASAMAVILLVGILIITFVNFRIGREGHDVSL